MKRIIYQLLRPNGTGNSPGVAEKAQENSHDSALDRGVSPEHAVNLDTVANTELMRRLPTEIWSEIFILCLPTTSPFVNINTRHAPLLLGQICSSWRSIAYSTPKLWNSLKVSLKQNSVRGSEPLIHAWVMRSGDLPLDISIYDSQPLPGLMTSRLLNIFAETSSRWRVVLLNMPLASMCRLIGGQGAMAALESLEICFTADTLFQGSLFIAESATRLRKLKIRTGSSMQPRRLIFPWAQLTHFISTSPLDTDECLQVFRLCPGVENLYLRMKWGSIVDAPLTPCPLPELTSLGLCPSGKADILFDSIITPRLRQLKLDLYSYGGTPDAAHEWPKEALLSLFSRSSCPLEELALHGKCIKEDDLADFVRLVPTLVKIVIIYQGKDIVPSPIVDILTTRIKDLSAATGSPSEELAASS